MLLYSVFVYMSLYGCECLLPSFNYFVLLHITILLKNICLNWLMHAFIPDLITKYMYTFINYIYFQ